MQSQITSMCHENGICTCTQKVKKKFSSLGQTHQNIGLKYANLSSIGSELVNDTITLQ